ncbi:Aspartate/tyrosine/aromatic aminotransferase [Archaeoglobus sulfaticallidus PM70-1]|uniref:Aminotransferase n=1 Tax=Archaeoglobus sulfaticallidus PM70-1 TaxID=387631 RepID=N0BHQ6_9EURY|nr:aminotransferase class I/II-fold pyridoxal phosphate-dependent enzyme [Archaeoglobus sulfaticallidus]AGK61847.1 Aspartate/tyrosine/aromatic aminotransferase [Archaeoglobus sulfaticallidus PM70-1]
MEKMKEKKKVNEKLLEIKPSGIRRFFDLIIGREDVISLGVGEPDFPTPWRIREEMIYSLEKGITSYTSNYGLEELRVEIAKYYRKFGLDANPDNIVVTSGVSEGFDLSLRATVNPGDFVLIPEPSYVSYQPLAILCGGNVVTISIPPPSRLTYEEITTASRMIDPKILILNYPSNPTGVSYSKKELEEIADAVVEMDMIVISDEIYSELTYKFPHTSIAGLNGMEDRVVVLNGFSKSFAMTGLRIGYVIAPDEILDAVLKIHQYSMLCAPITSQIGAIEALRNGESELDEMRAEYMRRRNFFVRKLNEVLETHMPEGAFYAFPSIKDTGLSSEEFAERLLLEKNVAVVPGNAFGESGEGYIRCAYAVSMDKLREAADRISEFVNSLR